MIADRIGVIGTGYVGLVTAAAFARLGRCVVCHDNDESRLVDLANGRVPFYEVGLPETLAEAAEKYRAAVDLNPGHAGMHVNYGVALLRLGQWERGLAELRTAVRQDPSNSRFQRALEDALAQAPPHLR